MIRIISLDKLNGEYRYVFYAELKDPLLKLAESSKKNKKTVWISMMSLWSEKRFMEEIHATLFAREVTNTVGEYLRDFLTGKPMPQVMEKGVITLKFDNNITPIP